MARKSSRHWHGAAKETVVFQNPRDGSACTGSLRARISAGFHYRFSTRVGADIGRKIGHYVVQTGMQPLAITDKR
jgi:hypothetical protein